MTAASISLLPCPLASVCAPEAAAAGHWCCAQGEGQRESVGLMTLGLHAHTSSIPHTPTTSLAGSHPRQEAQLNDWSTPCAPRQLPRPAGGWVVCPVCATVICCDVPCATPCSPPHARHHTRVREVAIGLPLVSTRAWWGGVVGSCGLRGAVIRHTRPSSNVSQTPSCPSEAGQAAHTPRAAVLPGLAWGVGGCGGSVCVFVPVCGLRAHAFAPPSRVCPGCG